MKKIPDPNKMKRFRGPVMAKSEGRQAKIRITTYLDADVLSHLKTVARESGGKYQTTLNQALREYFMNKKSDVTKRIERLEKAVFRRPV